MKSLDDDMHSQGTGLQHGLNGRTCRIFQFFTNPFSESSKVGHRLDEKDALGPVDVEPMDGLPPDNNPNLPFQEFGDNLLPLLHVIDEVMA